MDIFNVPEAADALAFRGGTALYRLYLNPPARYSEDIDLVQVVAGPIGGVLDALRARLDPWLGAPRRTLKEGRVVLLFRMQSEGPTPLPLRLKIEIADPMFTRDIEPLLAPRAEWDQVEAGRYAREELLARLPGEPWKGSEA